MGLELFAVAWQVVELFAGPNARGTAGQMCGTEGGQIAVEGPVDLASADVGLYLHEGRVPRRSTVGHDGPRRSDGVDGRDHVFDLEGDGLERGPGEV